MTDCPYIRVDNGESITVRCPLLTEAETKLQAAQKVVEAARAIANESAFLGDHDTSAYWYQRQCFNRMAIAEAALARYDNATRP